MEGIRSQPLAMDWREKIKAAKSKPAEAPKPAAAKPEPVKYASKPDLEALSVGLPQGWKALWDKKSSEIFYGNPTTKVGRPVDCGGHLRRPDCRVTRSGSTTPHCTGGWAELV